MDVWSQLPKVWPTILLGLFIFLSQNPSVYCLDLHPTFGGSNIKEYSILVEPNLLLNLGLLGILEFTTSPL